MAKEELNYYHSFANVDIWENIDTVSGKFTYVFWCKGQSYERPTFEDAIETIRALVFKGKEKTNGNNTR